MRRHHTHFGVLASLSRLVGGLLQSWPLIALALFFLSAQGPHLRLEYTYRETGGYRAYLGCTYVGSRGIVQTFGEDCPFIAWLDSRKWNR